MEEVYVIKLRGLPATEPGSEAKWSADHLIREVILGLGVLHIVLGLVSFVFGILGLQVEYDASHTGVGIWSGVVFLLTGISGTFAWRCELHAIKVRLFFCLSIGAGLAAIVHLVLSCYGLAVYLTAHAQRQVNAPVSWNAVLTAILELVVALASALMASRLIWPKWLPSNNWVHPKVKQKVIVATNIFGADAMKVACASDVVQHVSPNCVISFRQDEQQRQRAQRVQQFLHDSAMTQLAGESIGANTENGSACVKNPLMNEDENFDGEHDTSFDSETWGTDAPSLPSNEQSLEPQQEQETNKTDASKDQS